MLRSRPASIAHLHTCPCSLRPHLPAVTPLPPASRPLALPRPPGPLVQPPFQAACTGCHVVCTQVRPWPASRFSHVSVHTFLVKFRPRPWRSLYSKSLYNVTDSGTTFIVRMPPLGHELIETKEFCLLISQASPRYSEHGLRRHISARNKR